MTYTPPSFRICSKMNKISTICLQDLPRDWNNQFIYEWVNRTMKFTSYAQENLSGRIIMTDGKDKLIVITRNLFFQLLYQIFKLFHFRMDFNEMFKSCKYCENWNDFLYLTTNKEILVEVSTPKMKVGKENYRRCRCEVYLKKFLNSSEIIVKQFVSHKLSRFSCLPLILVKDQNLELYDNLRSIVFINEGFYAGSIRSQPIIENEIPLSAKNCPLMMLIRYCYQVRSLLDTKMETFEDVVKSFDEEESEVFNDSFDKRLPMRALLTSTPNHVDSV